MTLLQHQRNRLIIFGIVLLLGGVVFLMTQGILPGLRHSGPAGPKGPPPITLTVWNVFEGLDQYSDIIAEYQKANPNITIKYEKVDYLEYRQKLLDAFASGTAPDIFAIHNTWLPLEKNRVSPMPKSLPLQSEFEQVFPRVVGADFTRVGENGERNIYALPLSVETLGLFYNKDYFETANIGSPPKTWEELVDYAKLFTQLDDAGKIKISGVALGSSGNINRAADIISLLMLQAGAHMNNELLSEATFDDQVWVGEGPEQKRFSPGKEALQFYLAFSDPTANAYSWNADMPYSIDAFVEGKTAMMINYPHHIGTIMSKAPHLNIEVASMPQLKDGKENINYASYWGFAVSKISQNKDAAWNFVNFLVQPENAKKYAEKAKMPVSRLDLILWQQQDPSLKHFANQITEARSWYEGDSTAVETILEDMITAAGIKVKTIDEALEDAAARVTVVLQKVRE